MSRSRFLIRGTGLRSGRARRFFAVAVLASAALMAGPALSSSAATYVWMNKSIAPNGTKYTETTAAGQFSRTGISASIAKAAGYTWETIVWYNGYYNVGNSTATQNGPRGWGKTQAKFTYAWYQSGDKVDVKAWLLDAKLNGAARASTVGLLDEEDADVPASARVTAADLRSGFVDGFDLTSYGATPGGELWTGAGGDTYCIFVAQGDYLASSCNPAEVATGHGVAIHASNADGSQSMQAVFSPIGGITDENASAVGLNALSQNVAINTSTPVSGEFTSVSARARGAQTSVVIPILKMSD